ncbi:Cu(I)-responsive transcriptional regulator [Luteimonas aquatica]|uniref:Cu(I)-responsive transcriptional regulator n=1 Tax=Luteimonas aquatica TaxID=450364 RepID=UPI001F584829|nr:Cu(I)-responsive transcriptional regulator [Luteimonas aquatica]
MAIAKRSAPPSRRRDPHASLELNEARTRGFYEIGEAAAASGVSAKMVRHYERIGLIPPATRTFANYRIYNENDLHTLRFIKRARSLGFSIDDIQMLLGLWNDQSRASSEVKALAQGHIRMLEEKIAGLQDMRQSLVALADACHGNDRPECPILEQLGASLENTAHDRPHEDSGRRPSTAVARPAKP